MKLKEYIKNLQDVLDSNPEYAELAVITAKDEEGNGFNTVYFEPSLGRWHPQYQEFTTKDNFGDLDESEQIINSICVN